MTNITLSLSPEQAESLRRELRRASRQYRELVGAGHDDSECLERSVTLAAIADALVQASKAVQS